MPMNVEQLKKLTEDLCFVKPRRSNPFRDYLVKYLQTNKGTAYSITDLVSTFRDFRKETISLYKSQLDKIENKADRRALSKRYMITDDGGKIKTKINNCLKAELKVDKPVIKKKGSYYWYDGGEDGKDL